MKALLTLISLLAMQTLACSAMQPADAKRKTFVYRTGLTRWKAAGGGFAAWTLDGVTLDEDGALRLDLSAAQTANDPPVANDKRNFYNGKSYRAGEATGPEVDAGFAFTEVIPSWNADTPPGTWVEMQLRLRIGRQWTKWYSLGVWASDASAVERHSVKDQQDDNASVSVDTLVLTKTAADAVQASQVRLRLFSAGDLVPTVRNVWAAYSSARPKSLDGTAPGSPELWNTRLDVPQCSQMVYPDGGNVWCSPTSVSMVLAYWREDGGPCEPRVRHAVDGVYDWVYDGHGNWPFNAAYAAAQSTDDARLEAFVTRFTGLAEAEKWIAADVPVIVSYAWKAGELTGAPVTDSNGHLGVLIGFDAEGNPILNDPAAADDAGVLRIYPRQEFETVWLTRSGGAVYLIYPQGWKTPE